MNSEFQMMDHVDGIFHGENADEMVSLHFERLFVLFDTFLEDPKISLLQVENAFRSEGFQASPSVYVAYRWATERIMASLYAEAKAQGQSLSLLCLLLKELGNLDYSEIAEMTSLSRKDVAGHIANLRHQILTTSI